MKTIAEIRSLKHLINLEGRVALVTGGAGHIGSVICDTLAELGSSIVVLDKAQETCAQVANRIETVHGVKTMSLPLDLEDEKKASKIPEQVLNHFGHLDILVHCAALVGTSELEGWNTKFIDQNVDTWRKALEVNLTAPFVLTQACARALNASDHASVITIGSIYGMLGPNLELYQDTSMGNPAAYAASKGGLLQLTRWLATVLAPKVRANAITLGGIWRNQPDEFQRRYVERTPMKRMATEEDLKGAIAYLASDLSAYVTGHNLVVDGGWTVW